MHAIQVNHALCPQAYLRTTPHVQRQNLFPHSSIAFGLRLPGIPASVKLTNGGQKCVRLTPVCMAREDAVSGNGNQEPVWKSLGKVFGNFGPKRSIEDLLEEQIKKGEYYDEGGYGGDPPGRRGGGGGGGGGGSLGGGGSEDEGETLEEAKQVFLATLALILLYLYIISGEEMKRLVRDFFIYLFKGTKSVRLARVLDKWDNFRKLLVVRKVVDKFWLEKAILKTPTWWDSPQKYRRILRAYKRLKRRRSGDDNDDTQMQQRKSDDDNVDMQRQRLGSDDDDAYMQMQQSESDDEYY